MIKAIFFDIDGTLVSFNTHEVPQSTVKAIEGLRKKGIKLFIATGRHRIAINNLGDLQFDGYITLNGGYCFDKDGPIYKHPITRESIATLIEEKKKDDTFPCIFVREKDMFINYKNGRVDEILELLNFPEPPSGTLDEALQEDVFQLISFFGEDDEKKMMEMIPGCESTRWNPLFTDVVPRGSSKSVGIDKVLEHYGIAKEECLAFGDGGNDIAMLRHIPHSIAMGNAEDDVKAAASYVTTSVDEDGIYKALKHLGIL